MNIVNTILNAIILTELENDTWDIILTGLKNNIWEIIITGLGVIIACLQLRLSKQIYRQEITKERGYFIIEKTNLRKKDADDYDKCADWYDLKNALLFRLCGNGDVFLLREKIIINNIIVRDKQLLETFFSIYDGGSHYGILLPLKSTDNMLLRLDVEIILELKNIMGNIYIEKILLEFRRDNEQMKWTLHKKNTSFISK